mmetsp:Transcript_74439/g.198959  ORF Transcript_74439/g.198959 Transcript_74439/m.198959 type:complete len:450 (+) Transcript_74439:1063-2412(+)
MIAPASRTVVVVPEAGLPAALLAPLPKPTPLLRPPPVLGILSRLLVRPAVVLAPEAGTRTIFLALLPELSPGLGPVPPLLTVSLHCFLSHLLAAFVVFLGTECASLSMNSFGRTAVVLAPEARLLALRLALLPKITALTSPPPVLRPNSRLPAETTMVSLPEESTAALLLALTPEMTPSLGPEPPLLSVAQHGLELLVRSFVAAGIFVKLAARRTLVVIPEAGLPAVLLALLPKPAAGLGPPPVLGISIRFFSGAATILSPEARSTALPLALPPELAPGLGPIPPFLTICTNCCNPALLRCLWNRLCNFPRLLLRLVTLSFAVKSPCGVAVVASPERRLVSEHFALRPQTSTRACPPPPLGAARGSQTVSTTVLPPEARTGALLRALSPQTASFFGPEPPLLTISLHRSNPFHPTLNTCSSIPGLLLGSISLSLAVVSPCGLAVIIFPK